MQESKTKLFIENFLVYGLGGIISKAIPIIMVPVLTRMMPNSEYFGISDMSNTLISFASAFAMLGLYDGMFRIYFDKEDLSHQKATCSSALIFTIISSIVAFSVLLMFRRFFSQVFFKDDCYYYIVIIDAFAVLFGTTNRIVSGPTRLQNKRLIYLVVNFVSPVLSYTLAIVLLLKGYYTIALPVGTLVSFLAIEVYYYVINRDWFKISSFDISVLKQMLFISLPLLPNFLIYWVFNSSDKLMITNILDLGQAGIYGIASKFGHCSQLLYTAFAGGWSFFVFSTMKDRNQISYNSKLFEILGMISLGTTVIVCFFAKSLFKILFPQEYLDGYISSVYLFLCPLLQMLFQIAVSQFTIIKKTWYNTLFLFGGAIVNVLLNIVLIPQLGIEGAAIGTLGGYLASLIGCLLVLDNIDLFFIGHKFFRCTLLFIAYFLSWRFKGVHNTLLSGLLSIIVIAVYCVSYRADIYTFSKKLLQRTKKRKNL